MLFVTVILFNLLIAVIGDAYDRVCKDGDVHLARSRAALVVETELLLPASFVRRRDAALLCCDSLLVMQVRGDVRSCVRVVSPGRVLSHGVLGVYSQVANLERKASDELARHVPRDGIAECDSEHENASNPSRAFGR